MSIAPSPAHRRRQSPALRQPLPRPGRAPAPVKTPKQKRRVKAARATWLRPNASSANVLPVAACPQTIRCTKRIPATPCKTAANRMSTPNLPQTVKAAIRNSPTKSTEPGHPTTHNTATSNHPDKRGTDMPKHRRAAKPSHRSKQRKAGGMNVTANEYPGGGGSRSTAGGLHHRDKANRKSATSRDSAIKNIRAK